MKALASRRARASVAVALGVACLIAGTTAYKRSAQSTSPVPSAIPVDPPLLAFLSRSRCAHHRADLLEERGQLQPAIGELEKITTGPLPPEGLVLAEVREVLADTRARLADLRSQAGDLDGALRDIQAGLELAPGATYFRGHLLEIEGLVEERRARSSEKSAEDLLSRAEERVADERGELQGLRGQLEAAEHAERQAVPSDLDRLRAERLRAAAELARSLERGLTADERASYDRLRRRAAAAKERALAAFERSMAVQAQVIEESVGEERR